MSALAVALSEDKIKRGDLCISSLFSSNICFVKKEIYDDIVQKIGAAPIESGGILGIKDGVICSFYFDHTSPSRNDEYIPDISVLNEGIKIWFDLGIDFAGIVHSHPNSYDRPSSGDYIYVRRLKKSNPQLEKVFFPIVTKTNEKTNITFYIYENDFNLAKVKII